MCLSWGEGRIDCFILGVQPPYMYHKYYNGSDWIPSPGDSWARVGTGVGTATPHCLSYTPTRIDCFMPDTMGEMLHKWAEGDQWFPVGPDWEKIGGSFTSTPSCVSTGEDYMDCFATGSDGAMYHKSFRNGVWKPSQCEWENLGGQLHSSPDCTAGPDGRIDCFGRDANNDDLIHKAWNGEEWVPSLRGWESLGGPIASVPDCFSWEGTGLQCFALSATDGWMVQKWSDDYINWYPAGTSLKTVGEKSIRRPSCVPVTSESIYCFESSMFEPVNALQYKRWVDERWTPERPDDWDFLGGKMMSDPRCLSWGPERIDCFIRAFDNSVMHINYVP